MGFLLRKQWTSPLPPGAVVETVDGVRTARWRLRNGEPRTAEVFDGAGGPRIRGRTETYVARYRDAEGLMREHPTGCRDQKAARAVLHELERQVEKIRSGLLRPEEVEAATHARRRFDEHVADYLRHLELRSGASHRRNQVRARLERIAAECKITRLTDLTPATIEPWMSAQKQAGMGASTLAGYRQVAVALANWAVKDGRLLEHRLDRLPRANPKLDRRRNRRALTADELIRLIDAARRRPLYGVSLIRVGPQRGQLGADVDDHVRRRLELLGEERSLAYRILVTTGLRRSELASITLADVALDEATPHFRLAARSEKSRRGATIPLRGDVAAEIRRWLVRRLQHAQERAERLGLEVPKGLPSTAKLVNVPTIRTFDADLDFAGIAKVDDQGRTLDLHCLRVSFCSHLARAGVSLATAQRAMRHSTPVLTANVYTDPALLDVAGAIEMLPSLSVPSAAAQAASAA